MPLLTADQLRDCDALLAVTAGWLTGNADRWVKDKVASPGMIADSVTKIVDQRLDMEKQAGEKCGGGAGESVGEVLAATRRELGLYTPPEQDG
jgi:hypothetical protein